MSFFVIPLYNIFVLKYGLIINITSHQYPAMDQAIKEILGKIEAAGEETPHFQKKGYAPFSLSKDNFHEIIKTDSKKPIAFIDGGNQEIAGSNSFSLQLLRVYYTIYQDNKRIEKEAIDAFALVTVERKDKELNYSVKIFPKKTKLELDHFTFDLYDKTLSTGAHAVKPETIGDTVRKFMELLVAKKLCAKIHSGIIVLDTTLEATVTGEKKIFDRLYSDAEKNGVAVCALSKTTNLLTESGNSVLAVLQAMSPKTSWSYHPLARITSEDHKADIYLVKLHEKSKYVFRLDIYNKSISNADEIISLLSLNSKDAVFLGYPYGLIEADKRARVTNREIEVEKTKLFVKLGKDFEKMRSYLNTKNAHDILDNIG